MYSLHLIIFDWSLEDQFHVYDRSQTDWCSVKMDNFPIQEWNYATCQNTCAGLLQRIVATSLIPVANVRIFVAHNGWFLHRTINAYSRT